MLILFTILVVLSAVIAIPFLLKTRKSLPTENTGQLEPPHFRSLFEPSEQEMLALEREEKAQLKALQIEEEREISDRKIEKVRQFQNIWQTSPDKKNTIELIYLAAASDSAKIFSEITESVIKHWQAGKIENFSAGDLAAVLESHFRLLPTKERTSGVAFWLKREIAGLRAWSSGKN